MKEKILKNKKAIIILVATLLLLSFVGLCSWGIPVLIENSNGETVTSEDDINSEIEAVTDINEYDDLYDQENGIMDFIKVTYNDFNGKDYKFSLDNEDISFTKIGTQFSTKDYVYTYGYFWSENDAKIVPRDNSLEGWTKQESDIGWGVAVKDRGKTTYEGVYNTIAGEPVTWMNATYYNCVNMTSIPLLPSNVKHTDYMFYNCISLKSAILPSGMTTLGTGMFYKCSALQYVYLPKTINNIALDGVGKYKASLDEAEIRDKCMDVSILKLPDYCISNAGHQFSIAPNNGVLALSGESYYFISATSPNYVTTNSNGNLYLRSEGSDGNGLWVFWYNNETGQWEQIIDYAGGYTNIIPSYQGGFDPQVFTEIIYTSHDLYKEENKNEIYRKADEKSFLDGIYYGREAEYFGAFKYCNSKLKIYCEHEEKPENLSNALKGKVVEYKINHIEMLEIKHDIYKDS